MTLPPERELPLALARERIDDQLDRLALEMCAYWEGEQIGSARVQLRSAAGLTCQGSGKGLEPEAMVGARFEALEHYLDEHAERDCQLRLASELAKCGALRDDPSLPWLRAQPEQSMACQPYHDLDGQWVFDYPLCLTRPDYADSPVIGDTFDYRALRRYSSNDGSAIGATRNEAILHALNQCIERDALSLFFLAHYYYQLPDPLRWVEMPSVETSLGQLWRQAEHCLEAPIQVLDISSVFASGTYLALRMDDPERPHGALFGAGASLDPWHGVRRAISELVQVQLNSRLPGAMDEERQARRHLTPFPKLQRCLQLDLTTLLEKPGQILALPHPTRQLPVIDQVRYLYDDLHAHGHHVGICELFRGHQGVSMVNVVVPGLERFHLVTSGNVVCPGVRGKALQPTTPRASNG